MWVSCTEIGPNLHTLFDILKFILDSFAFKILNWNLIYISYILPDLNPENVDRACISLHHWKLIEIDTPLKEWLQNRKKEFFFHGFATLNLHRYILTAWKVWNSWHSWVRRKGVKFLTFLSSPKRCEIPDIPESTDWCEIPESTEKVWNSWHSWVRRPARYVRSCPTMKQTDSSLVAVVIFSRATETCSRLTFIQEITVENLKKTIMLEPS